MQTLTIFQEKTVQHQYDNYVKKGLRWACRNYFKKLNYLSEHETPFSELSEEKMARLFVMDTYPSDYIPFFVRGYLITVQNEYLAKALAALTAVQRDIVLLSYFLDMSDQEIADELSIPRRTIQHWRINTVEELKTKLEEMHNDTKKE